MESLSRNEVGAALEVVSGDLARVEEIMAVALETTIPFLTESATYLTKAAGKRLRPALVFLCSMMGAGPTREVDLIAAAVEMTHLATLCHDDVMDEAEVRHGILSAHEKWGNTVAILAGDFLLARASALAAQVGGEIARILAEAVGRVVQGQVRELGSAFDPRRTADHYFATLEEKTVTLLQTPGRLGAMLGGCDGDVITALTKFGHAFGLSFQIADDLLDLSATQEDLGKPPGTDLRVGVYTLPVIYAGEADSSLYAILGRPEADIDAVRAVLLRTGAFDRARGVAGEYAQKALDALENVPEGRARTSLEQMSRLIVDRVPELTV